MFATPEPARTHPQAIGLRCLMALGVILGLSRFVELGTPALLVSLTTIVGILAARFLAARHLTIRGATVGLLVAGLLVAFLFWVAFKVSAAMVPGSLWLAGIYDTTILLGGAFSIGLISTLFFLRSRHTLTIELMTLAAGFIWIFSNHRNFHFDTPANTPQLINSIAWTLHTDHVAILVLLGGSILVGLLLYALSSRPTEPAQLHRRSSTILSVGAAAVFGLFLWISGSQIHSYYLSLAETRVSNGVGQAAKEGLSPLSFHSALGSTNQPAGLVRLESDYPSNPFTPLLYLRESALSEFNGKEFVRASPEYDTDVPDLAPAGTYRAEEDAALFGRIKITQSVYLLTDHKNAFGIDYPVSMHPLANPDPSRFRSAFQVLSVVPTFAIKDIGYDEPGDPRWSPTVRAHYLVQHPDPRYRDLAESLSAGATTPVMRIARIANYLIDTAVYTLAPNHTVDKDGDPVAAFLFGDLRGYCVHFAHAVTYMARSLGIPARVATGYLTDLSQAKDGHILLRMSDRHAWAEIYLNGRGWVPIDVQPTQVESHADSEVDMKVLEELMAKLGPGEDILPEAQTANEPGMQEESPWPQIRMDWVLMGLVGLLGLGIVGKLYLRFSYLLPASPKTKLWRAYRTELAALADLGITRAQGETRTEFQRRVKTTKFLDMLSLTPPLVTTIYNPGGHLDTERTPRPNLRPLSRFPWYARVLGILNPSTLFAWLTRRRW